MWKWVRTGCLIGALLCGIFGAVGGLTGMMRTEYKAKPWEEAIMLAWMVGVYGAIAGAIGGRLAWDFSRWLNQRR